MSRPIVSGDLTASIENFDLLVDARQTRQLDKIYAFKQRAVSLSLAGSLLTFLNCDCFGIYAVVAFSIRYVLYVSCLFLLRTVVNLLVVTGVTSFRI